MRGRGRGWSQAATANPGTTRSWTGTGTRRWSPEELALPRPTSSGSGLCEETPAVLSSQLWWWPQDSSTVTLLVGRVKASSCFVL